MLNINKKWCVHPTLMRLISNGVHWVQQLQRPLQCIFHIIIIIIQRQPPQLRIPTTGIIQVHMTMQPISPHRIPISHHLIGLVQQQVQLHQHWHHLEQEDYHQQAQHRLPFLHHYPIEIEQKKHIYTHIHPYTRTPIVLLYTMSLLLLFLFLFSSELKNHTPLSARCLDDSCRRHLEKNICMKMWQWMSLELVEFTLHE